MVEGINFNILGFQEMLQEMFVKGPKISKCRFFKSNILSYFSRAMMLLDNFTAVANPIDDHLNLYSLACTWIACKLGSHSFPFLIILRIRLTI